MPSSPPEKLARIGKHMLQLRKQNQDRPADEQLSEDQIRRAARRREEEGLLNDAGHYVEAMK